MLIAFFGGELPPPPPERTWKRHYFVFRTTWKADAQQRTGPQPACCLSELIICEFVHEPSASCVQRERGANPFRITWQIQAPVTQHRHSAPRAWRWIRTTETASAAPRRCSSFSSMNARKKTFDLPSW